MKMLVLLTTCILIISCGMETGNPKDLNSGIGTINISYSICSKLESCGADYDSCINSIAYEPNFGIYFETVAYGYNNLAEVISGVKNSEISFNSGNYEQCNTEVLLKSCSSSLIENSWDPSNPSDFSNSFQILNSSPTCKNIYTP
ncbi:MAG: hypothetical protein AB8E15_12215 [Bdellovibrionales bacterium]